MDALRGIIGKEITLKISAPDRCVYGTVFEESGNFYVVNNNGVYGPITPDDRIGYRPKRHVS